MCKSIILMNVERGFEGYVKEILSSYGGMVKNMTEKVGEYDLIIEVETDSEENLQLFVKNELRSIPFIEKTMPVVLQY